MKILSDLLSNLNLEAGVQDIRQGANFRQIKGIELLTMKKDL